MAVSRSKAWPTNDSPTLVDNSAFEWFPRNKGSLRRGQSGLFLRWKQSTKEQRRKKNGVEIRISSDSKNPFLGRDTDRRPITTCLECRRAAFSNFAQLRARLVASPSFSTIEDLRLSGENTETLGCRIINGVDTHREDGHSDFSNMLVGILLRRSITCFEYHSINVCKACVK